MLQRHRCAMLAAMLTAGGCTMWHPLAGAGLDRPQREWLGEARVILRDGTVLELDQTTITRDSVVGVGGENRVRMAVVRRDVDHVDARQLDGRKTFIAGGVTGLSMLALWIVALIAAMSGEYT